MKSVLVLPIDVEDHQKRTLSVIQLPNPSNTECKTFIDLLLSSHTEHDTQKQTVYQLKGHHFSKGTSHNKFKDRENYYYKDSSIPLKSLIIHNSNDMHEGELCSNGEMKIAFKYDLTFSLIGALVAIAMKRVQPRPKTTTIALLKLLYQKTNMERHKTKKKKKRKRKNCSMAKCSHMSTYTKVLFTTMIHNGSTFPKSCLFPKCGMCPM